MVEDISTYKALALALIVSAIKDAIYPVYLPNALQYRQLARDYLAGEMDDHVPIPVRMALELLDLPNTLCDRFRQADPEDFRDFLKEKGKPLWMMKSRG